MRPTGRLLTSLPAYRSQLVASSTEERKEGKDRRKEVNNVWRADQRRRLPVLLLIKAKCFKEGKTERGQTAARMMERKGGRKQCVKEDSVKYKALNRNVSECEESTTYHE